MNRTAESALLVLRAGQAKLGLPLPAALDEDLATIAEVSGRADALFATTPDLGQHVLDALRAGRDPAADPTVVATVTRASLAGTPGVRAAVDGWALAEHRRVLAVHFDALVASWRNLFDPAAARIAEVQAAAPHSPLDPRLPAGQVPASLLGQWRQACDDADRLDAIAQMWITTAQFCRAANVDVPRSTALVVTADVRGVLGMSSTGARPRDVIDAGLVLNLASAAEHAERCAALAAEQDADAHATAAAQRDAVQRRYGAGTAIA